MNLFTKAEELGLTMREVMLEAGVDPKNAYFWKESGRQRIDRWLKLLKTHRKAVPKPGVSTWSVFGDQAEKVFTEAGYTKQQALLTWSKGDPKMAENYKKVYHLLKKKQQNA